MRCPPEEGWTDIIITLYRRNKKPGGEVANPHAGFLDFNLVSWQGQAVSHQLSAVS